MRPHGKYATVDASDPESFSQCDSCGFWYNSSKLNWQMQWAGTQLQNTGSLVCPRCYDTPNEQLRTIILPPDPVAVENARVPNFAYEEAGPVQSNLTLSALQGATVVFVQAVTGFTVGMSVWVQLNNATFAGEVITGIDTLANSLTVSIPLPAVAPVNGTVTQALT